MSMTIEQLQEQNQMLMASMQTLMAKMESMPKVEKVPAKKPKAETWKRPAIAIKQTGSRMGQIIRISTPRKAISKAGKEYNAFLDVPLYQLEALEELISNKQVMSALKKYLKTGEPVEVHEAE